QLAPKDGPADLGDVVTAEVTAKDGDRVLKTLPEVQVRVEPKLAFQDGVSERFGEQIKGAKAGDTRPVDVVLSTAVSDGALRGKTVQAAFQVKDVKTIRMPEASSDFLQAFGVKTEEQLDELIRVILQRRLEYLQRQTIRRQVLEQLASSANWELPQDLL